MQKVFENVIEMLGRKRAYYNAKFESTQNLHEKDEATTRFEDFNEAIEIVKQAAAECKHGHFGCNTNGQHEKCSTCCDYDCKNRNREWFGLKDDNNGWIPCSERLPKLRQDVLVTVKYTGFMGMYGYWIKTGHMEAENDWWGDCAGGEVIAWQPLPEPFKERD